MTAYNEFNLFIGVVFISGCFVPCQHASIPIRNRIMSRIGNADDMEHNLSSFMTEMRESAYILNNITVKSLVIIDELGRGTSNIDGAVLCRICDCVIVLI